MSDSTLYKFIKSLRFCTLGMFNAGTFGFVADSS